MAYVDLSRNYSTSLGVPELAPKRLRALTAVHQNPVNCWAG